MTPTFLLLFFIFSSRKLLAYKIAVVEYYPSNVTTAEDTISNNLDGYRSFADDAKEQATDMVVYPEYGLTTFVTDPADYSIEVTTNSSTIHKLSVIAKERQIYLVINLLEKELDTNNQAKYFNTDLVFDRDGKIILKYRKINLYEEEELTPGSIDQEPIFTTDFGVTFAVFTGFDIFFTNPSRRVLENRKVTDVIYLSAWESKTLFYNSLSTQHGYSVANGVNLLAAHYGGGGSGIYLTKARIAEMYTIADCRSSKLLFQQVSKFNAKVDKANCVNSVPYGLPGSTSRLNVSYYVTQKKAFNASRFTFKNVDLTQNTSMEVCHGDFCCTFDIILGVSEIRSVDIYKIMVFDGKSDFIKDTHVRICSLVLCLNASDDSCGGGVPTTTKFKNITVRGNLEKDNSTFYTPVTSNIADISYCDTNNGTNSSYIELSTTREQEGVMFFGIFGITNAPLPKTQDEISSLPPETHNETSNSDNDINENNNNDTEGRSNNLTTEISVNRKGAESDGGNFSTFITGSTIFILLAFLRTFFNKS